MRTPVGPLKFQPGGRQALVPLFLGPYEAVNPPRYGAQFAQRRASAFPASKSLPPTAAGGRLQAQVSELRERRAG